MLELLVNGAPKTQNVSAVVGDLEGPEPIARIGQFPMHRNVPAYEFCVQRVGIIRSDVGVTGSPFVTRTIRLWMDLGRDGLEHEHDAVTSHDGEVVVSASFAAGLMLNVESQLRLIERNRRVQVVDDERGSNDVQHSEKSMGLKDSLR